MKSLYGRSWFETELRDLPDREVSGRMVRVKVHACGVCGTDLHFLRDSRDWLPLGHEISAEVVETGAEAARVKAGDRVIVEDVTMCGACEACKSGRYDLCQNPFRLDGQGGMADQMVVHENMLNRFDGVNWVRASMTEPLAVAITCVDKLKLPHLGSVLIYGMGAIGLLCAAYAKHSGASRVDLVARDPESLRNARAEIAARALGAEDIFYTKDPARTPPEGAYDAAIVAAAPELAAEALERVKYGGTVLVCGITLAGGGFAKIDVNKMVMNKKSLITSLAEPAINFPLSIRLIERGDIDVGAIITQQLPLSSAGELKSLYGRDDGAIKTVMLCN
jgi:threonine dehydrogenase-like Zn-dependent dehydrogenase